MSAETPPLCWGHPALDRVCRGLPAFQGLLLVAAHPADHQFLTELLTTNLIPAAMRAGLALGRYELDPAGIALAVRHAGERRLDAALFTSASVTPAWLASRCEEVAQLPCATLALLRTLPVAWQQHFDVCLELHHGRATIRFRDGRAQKEVRLPLRSEATPDGEASTQERTTSGEEEDGLVVWQGDERRALSVSAEASGPVMENAVVGLALGPDPSGPALARLLAALGIRVIQRRWDESDGDGRDDGDDRAGHGPLDLLIAAPGPDDPAWEARLARLAGRQPVIVLGSQLGRSEDRAACYRAGAAVVLPAEGDAGGAVDLEELVAATLGLLRRRRAGAADNAPELGEPFRLFDQELGHPPGPRTRERRTLFHADEVEEAVATYRSAVEAQLRRAFLFGTVAGALVVELPSPPLSVAGTPWVNVLRGSLKTAVSVALRKRDLHFIVDDRLIVLCHRMTPATSASMLARLHPLLQPPDRARPLRSCTLSAPVTTPHEIPQEATQLLRAAFRGFVVSLIAG